MEYSGLIALLLVLGTIGRWFWRAWAVDVPSTPIVFQGLAFLALLLGAASLVVGNEDSFAPWAIGVAVVFLYLSATGAQKVTGDTIEIGDVLPAFSAPDDQGNTFDSASLKGTGVLIKFFRGHW